MNYSSRVSITYHAANIIAGLLPSKHEHLSDDAKRAVIEFLGQVLRARTRQAAEADKADLKIGRIPVAKDPDT
jgi:hypothetical protein